MLSLSQLSALPRASGIYLVLDGAGQVLYIGQAQNIYQRWNSGHHKMAEILALEDSATTRIQSILLPCWLLNRAEHAAIASHQPKLNQRMPPVV